MNTDLLTVLGLLLAILAIVGGNMLEGGRSDSLVQTAAFVIVGGGTLAAVMVQTRLVVFRRALRMIGWAFYPPRDDTTTLIRHIIDCSRTARHEGLLALDPVVEREQEPFMRSGLQHLVDGTDPESLRRALDLEIHLREDREYEAVRVFESAGGYAPTIGILGAVLGLIHVLENLDDPDKLGAGIAVAFVATVYGVGFANLVFLPLAGKLKSLVRKRIRRLELIMEGVVAIAEGTNPRLIEYRLRAYEG